MPGGPPQPAVIDTVLTCHTDGCGNAEVSIETQVPEDADTICGACGEPITDRVVQK